MKAVLRLQFITQDKRINVSCLDFALKAGSVCAPSCFEILPAGSTRPLPLHFPSPRRAANAVTHALSRSGLKSARLSASSTAAAA